MGGSSTKTTTQEYDGIIVQSSLKGQTIPRGWGTAKVGCNLMDYLDFTAKKDSSAGKGGSAPAQYDYKATLMLGVCQGPVAGIRTIYKDQASFVATPSGEKEVNGATITTSPQTPVQAAGLTQLFLGAVGQAPWTYLTVKHSSHAIGYSGLCYAAAENYDLNSSASSPNHNFEVQFAVRATVYGAVIDDANPADIVADMLPRVPQWPGGAIGDLTLYSAYCQAVGLFISPVASDGRQASDLLTEILTVSNSDCCWSEGLLKITPYGDTAVTGNGVTYTPNLTPIYSLTLDDILQTSSGEDPIQWDFTRGTQAYNYLTVGFLDRTQQYASDSIPAVDQANINTYGVRRGNQQSFDSICLPSVASLVAQHLVQRSANVRRTAQFTLPETFGLLDPMDLINVPLRNGGQRLIRLVEINEQDDGSLECTAEEMLVGAGHAPQYPRQSAQALAGDYNADPGDVSAPVLFNAPTALTGGALEVWCAAAGLSPDWGGCNVWISLDGATYSQIGAIDTPARYGVLTAALPAGSDPDTTNTLSVDLTLSAGSLVSATQVEADGGATLCLIDGEIIGYESATATAANVYALTYLRRGQRASASAAHAAGATFVRLDDAIFKFSYPGENTGATVYVKFQSFNLYGGAIEDLSLCTAYTVGLSPALSLPGGLATAAAGGGLAIAGDTLVPGQPELWSGTAINMICGAADRATTYRFDFYAAGAGPAGATPIRSITSSTPSCQYTASQAAIDGAQRAYNVYVAPGNAAGAGPISPALGIACPAPSAPGGLAASGGAYNATVTWSAVAGALGYAVYFSQASGFGPETVGSAEYAGGTSITLYGLAAGTWYVTVAAYDAWSQDPAVLNFAAQQSFVISTGGGSGAPSGGGAGGGYRGGSGHINYA